MSPRTISQKYFTFPNTGIFLIASLSQIVHPLYFPDLISVIILETLNRLIIPSPTLAAGLAVLVKGVKEVINCKEVYNLLILRNDNPNQADEVSRILKKSFDTLKNKPRRKKMIMTKGKPKAITVEEQTKNDAKAIFQALISSAFTTSEDINTFDDITKLYPGVFEAGSDSEVKSIVDATDSCG